MTFLTKPPIQSDPGRPRVSSKASLLPVSLPSACKILKLAQMTTEDGTSRHGEPQPNVPISRALWDHRIRDREKKDWRLRRADARRCEARRGCHLPTERCSAACCKAGSMAVEHRVSRPGNNGLRQVVFFCFRKTTDLRVPVHVPTSCDVDSQSRISSLEKKRRFSNSIGP